MEWRYELYCAKEKERLSMIRMYDTLTGMSLPVEEAASRTSDAFGRNMQDVFAAVRER